MIKITNDLIKTIVDRLQLKHDGKNIFQYEEDKTRWKKISKDKESMIVADYFDKLKDEFTAEDINRIIKTFKVKRKYFHDFSKVDDTIVPVINGNYDIKTGEIHGRKREDYVVNVLDFQYDNTDKNAGCDIFEQFIRDSLGIPEGKIEDHTAYRRLMEFVGYSVSNLTGAKKMMLLIGPPHTGKSVIVHLLSRVREDTSICNFKRIGQRFYSSIIDGAGLVLNDELPVTGLTELDTLKKLISGDANTLEKKRQDVKVSKEKHKFLMAGNQMPGLAEPDHGHAFAERLSVVCFADEGLAEEKRNRNMESELFEHRDYIFTTALKYLRKFYENNQIFCEDKAGDAMLNAYKTSNNTAEAFLNDPDWVELGDDYRVYSTDIYAAYKEYCEEGLYTAEKKDVFLSVLANKHFRRSKFRIDKDDKNKRWGYYGLKLVRETTGVT